MLKRASGRAPARQRAVAMPNSVKRGAFDRMKKIFGLLQDGLYPNCTSILTDFEISLKTASRDLEFRREWWNLPIGYDDKRNVFFFTAKVERLQLVTATAAELFVVCISQEVLELYPGMPFQKPLELAFAKITRSVGDDERYMLEILDLAFSFRPFAPEDPDLRILELLYVDD